MDKYLFIYKVIYLDLFYLFLFLAGNGIKYPHFTCFCQKTKTNPFLFISDRINVTLDIIQFFNECVKGCRKWTRQINNLSLILQFVFLGSNMDLCTHRVIEICLYISGYVLLIFICSFNKWERRKPITNMESKFVFNSELDFNSYIIANHLHNIVYVLVRIIYTCYRKTEFMYDAFDWK